MRQSVESRVRTSFEQTPPLDSPQCKFKSNKYHLNQIKPELSRIKHLNLFAWEEFLEVYVFVSVDHDLSILIKVLLNISWL